MTSLYFDVGLHCLIFIKLIYAIISIRFRVICFIKIIVWRKFMNYIAGVFMLMGVQIKTHLID